MQNVKGRIMINILYVLAALCLFYGIFVRVAGSGGTNFFVVWIVMGACLFLLAIAMKKDLLKLIPGPIRVFAVAVCILLFASFLFVEGLIIRQMVQPVTEKLDYIIVLGAQVHKDVPSVVLKYRLDTAIEYLNENPDTVCIVSGGQGKNEPYAESEGMKKYLIENGIEKNRILEENRSKTTEENLKFSRQFLKEQSSVGIITNDFHMFRALQIAKKQGLNGASGIAAPSTKFYLPNNMLREYLAEIKFLLKNYVLQ